MIQLLDSVLVDKLKVERLYSRSQIQRLQYRNLVRQYKCGDIQYTKSKGVFTMENYAPISVSEAWEVKKETLMSEYCS